MTMVNNTNMGTDTIKFDNKIFTKEWLQENTTFAYPKNVVNLDDFDKAIRHLVDLPNGKYVWKPCYGRQNWGIALVEKNTTGFKVFPHNKVMSSESMILDLTRIKKLPIKGDPVDDKKWFVEEWIYPHERFHQFTDDKRLPPIIRFCGRHKVHFIEFSPVYFKLAGISPAGWGTRISMWMDFDGVIRRAEEIDLTYADKIARRIVTKRSVKTSFYGDKIEGIREIVNKIDVEISPKIKFNDARVWSVDGIFDQDNKFVIIEMNKAVAPGFIGVTWKR